MGFFGRIENAILTEVAVHQVERMARKWAATVQLNVPYYLCDDSGTVYTFTKKRGGMPVTASGTTATWVFNYHWTDRAPEWSIGTQPPGWVDGNCASRITAPKNRTADLTAHEGGSKKRDGNGKRAA